MTARGMIKKNRIGVVTDDLVLDVHENPKNIKE
jgi:hypothetical protein